MDSRALLEVVSKLIAGRNYHGAEKLLLEAQKQAEAEGDARTLHFVLSELIELYCISDPPLRAKAEVLSSERERVIPSAYSKLQTAMILYHGAHDYARAVPKLEAAIAQGKAERD